MPADYDYRNIFAELPEDEATALLSRMPCQSKASFWDKLTYAAYLHFPVTYLLPVHDRTIPVEAQKMMIEMARSQGAKITLKTCDSGHAPMLSIPDQVAELLINAAVSLV
jgi:pimeloyl-ACP methyl ester carboxylesterase